jgi:sialic acid synthase SpsE
LGSVQFWSGSHEANSRKFRRSLFVVEDIKKGELFTRQNVRSIRPADGLHPRHFNEVLGKRAACDIERGTPMSWELVES